MTNQHISSADLVCQNLYHTICTGLCTTLCHLLFHQVLLSIRLQLVCHKVHSTLGYQLTHQTMTSNSRHQTLPLFTSSIKTE